MNYQFRLTRNLSNPIFVKLGQLDDNRDERAAGLCSDDDWQIFGFDERQILGLGLCSDDDLQIFGVSTRGFAVSFEVSSRVKFRSENNFVQNIKNFLKNPNDIWKISKRRFLSKRPKPNLVTENLSKLSPGVDFWGKLARLDCLSGLTLGRLMVRLRWMGEGLMLEVWKGKESLINENQL